MDVAIFVKLNQDIHVLEVQVSVLFVVMDYMMIIKLVIMEMEINLVVKIV